MTTNRLAVADVAPRLSPPKDKAERRRFWIERGNRLLWGQEEATKGSPLTPRYDLEWACDEHGAYWLKQRAA